MTNKAYIVANEEQEREVLGKLERWGAEWYRSSKKPTDFIPSHVERTTKLPYALLVENDQISWCDIEGLYEFDDIVYDGRKEEQMSDKYVVSQEFMNELKEWKLNTVVTTFINGEDIKNLPYVINDWWFNSVAYDKEYNNRLIAIIRWVNGEDVFEVEKWVVRSESKDSEGDYWYVRLDGNEHNKSNVGYDIETATRFDTKEEAQSWANSHQEVVEVEI